MHGHDAEPQAHDCGTIVVGKSRGMAAGDFEGAGQSLGGLGCDAAGGDMVAG